MEGRLTATDTEIVERARRGDVGAYEELVRRYSQMAFRAAYLVTGNAADAEDAAQDAFVSAWRGLPRFRAGAPFRAWLLTIVGNAARNRRRSAGRRAAVEVRAGTAGTPVSPESAVMAAEERAELLRALARLDGADREVVACRHLLELSVEETAAILGVAAGTVKSRLHRALLRLRVQMEQVRG